MRGGLPGTGVPSPPEALAWPRSPPFRNNAPPRPYTRVVTRTLHGSGKRGRYGSRPQVGHRQSLGGGGSHRPVLRCAINEAALVEDPVPESDGVWAWRMRTIKRILAFAIPAVAIPLANPLLSVVDTVIVAQYAGTVDLAAMGPNTAIFGFVNYIFNSLGLATISVVAEKVNKGEDGSRALSTSLFVALVCGLASTVALQVWAEQLIRLSGVAPAVAGPALRYLQVRALAQPASLCILVCQAGLLAQKDSRTPVATVALAGLVNVVGDIFLMTQYNLGLVGAGIATVAAEVVEMAVMWAVLRLRGRAKPSLILPSWVELRRLLSILLPLSVVYICKNMCYVLVQWTATGLETLKLAAHQAMYSWWTLFAFAHAPVEHAALSFIPGAKGDRERMELMLMTVAFGLVVGTIGGALASFVPVVIPQFFTPDTNLWPLIRSLASTSFISMLLVGVDVGATSVLYANGDAPFIARAMGWNLLLMVAFFWAVREFGWGMQGVWWGIVFFFAIRVIWSAPRLWTRHLLIGWKPVTS